MADAIIGATVRVLLEKAISPATVKIGSVFGFKKDLEALREYAADIEAVLADAETKQTESQIVQRWLQKVERVAFDADIVLDVLNYEILRREVKSRNQSKLGMKKVCLFFSLSKHDLSFRWRMGSKVKDINEKLKNFNLEAPGLGLIRTADSPLLTTTEIYRQTNSLVPQFVAGRGKEESEIVDILLESSDKNVSVLPIVGMGGLGKTTLAKSVFNNQQIDTHFKKKIWICVSEKFEVTELFRLILESLKGGKKIEMSGQDAIVQEIRKELDGKRFLLVLDDVWNEDPRLWNDFFGSLVALCASNGSRCLLTTRLHRTANLASYHDPYILGKLSGDDCWSIITQNATKGGEMPEELIVHREEILKRCQGLPLAANAIGGLLSLQRREDWLSIVKNKIFMLSGDVKDDIGPILKLSFDNLPSPSIKKCFAYCSIFAKDTELDRDFLIELWMAEGFLESNVERGIMMEEVGDNYFRILLQSSLLENGEYISTRQYYQMHDLVHDFAESVSKTKSYVALDSFGEGMEKVSNAESPLVRTLFVNKRLTSISDEMLLKFSCLHVLKLELSGNLPSSINKLKHLRCLDLSRSEIKSLLESLCELYNLQTLRLDGCDLLEGLPQGMSNLINLRHLHCNNSNWNFQMPPEMGRLTCLQTLEFFNIGEEKGRGIEELGYMKELRGRLVIRKLELVKGKERARLANLSGKQNLRVLEFHWADSRVGDKQVLEGLEPHPNLQKLEISFFMGVRFPQWLGNLSSLVELNLNHCRNCTELPALGHLQSLKTLKLIVLQNVRCIGESFYGIEDSREAVSRTKVFPALKYLLLSYMRNLGEWKEVEAFPNLTRLDIQDCGQLATIPTHFPSLNKLEILGDCQVSVIKSIVCKTDSALKNLSICGMKGLISLTDVTGPASLERLYISNCKDLKVIPRETLECCASLKELWVNDCPNLESFPLDLQQNSSLSSIYLVDCPKLFTKNDDMPIGFNHLTNLTKLSMGAFSDDSIQLFDWSGLLTCSSTLQTLELYGSHQINALLPEQFQHLTSLTTLLLRDFESLEALPDWLGNLGSLQTLKLWTCPKLRYLPSVDSMGRLTKLRSSEIFGCPLLKESCKRVNDPHSEWSKISHLPNLSLSNY